MLDKAGSSAATGDVEDAFGEVETPGKVYNTTTPLGMKPAKSFSTLLSNSEAGCSVAENEYDFQNGGGVRRDENAGKLFVAGGGMKSAKSFSALMTSSSGTNSGCSNTAEDLGSSILRSKASIFYIIKFLLK